MKRKLTILMLLIVLLAGCSTDAREYEQKTKQYQSYWNAILNQDRFQIVSDGVAASRNFDVEATIEASSENEGVYFYDVVLNNPKRALYDVEVLVLDTNGDYSSSVMKPSAGIWEAGEYNLVPNQVNTEKGYMGGILLNGETDQTALTLRILVVWRDYTRLTVTQEFIEYPVAYAIPEEETETPAEEDSSEEGATEDTETPAANE